MRAKCSIFICLSFYLNHYISLTGDDNEGTTNDDEKSGKKGKRLRKKNLVVEEAVVGKRRRQHVVTDSQSHSGITMTLIFLGIPLGNTSDAITYAINVHQTDKESTPTDIQCCFARCTASPKLHVVWTQPHKNCIH